MCIRDSARAVSAAAPAVAATAMPTALLVEHMSYEGAGLLARWLPAAGVAVERCAVHAADRLAAVVSPAATGHAALVVMGGPMSAYDDEASPWLPAELTTIAATVAAGTPVLGVCPVSYTHLRAHETPEHLVCR